MFTKYLEHGLGIIPIKHGKNPGFEGWNAFCERLPSFTEATEWENNFNGNIGLPCGPASGVIAIDIDTEDSEVARLTPPSPVAKAGRRGETRFFKFNPEIKSGKVGIEGVCWIDILSTGRQTILPPSIHPETKEPYRWLTKDQFPHFDPNDLPTITRKDLTPVEEYIFKKYSAPNSKKLVELYNDDPSRESPHGAQAQMKSFISALIFQELPINEIVEKALKRDKELHKPVGYFEERGRVSDQPSTPFANCLKFTANLLVSINNALEREGKRPIELNEKVKEGIIDLSEFKKRKESQKKYPEGRGIIKEIQNYIDDISMTDCQTLSLGGSIALIGALISNRFQAQLGAHKVTPNVYILNIARSGFGKDSIQKFCRNILIDHKLLGAAAYKSDVSIVQDLPKQQERLDVIDEASSLLRLASSTKGFESNVADILTQLYSCASTQFGGISSAGNGSKAFACYRPHISILGSTTPAGFKTSVNRIMSLKGLMPRFSIFYQKESGEVRFPKEDEESDKNFNYIKSLLNSLLDSVPKLTPVKESNLLAQDMGINYAPRILKFTPEATKLWFSFYKDTVRQIQNDSDDKPQDGFKARWGEIAAKFALIDTISVFRDEITEDSVAWGIEIIKAQWEASCELYDMVHADNDVEAYAQRVVIAVRRYQDANNGEPMPAWKLFDNLTGVHGHIKKAAFEHLIDARKLFQIERKSKPGPGRPGLAYSIYPIV